MGYCFDDFQIGYNVSAISALTASTNGISEKVAS